MTYIMHPHSAQTLHHKGAEVAHFALQSHKRPKFLGRMQIKNTQLPQFHLNPPWAFHPQFQQFHLDFPPDELFISNCHNFITSFSYPLRRFHLDFSWAFGTFDCVPQQQHGCKREVVCRRDSAETEISKEFFFVHKSQGLLFLRVIGFIRKMVQTLGTWSIPWCSTLVQKTWLLKLHYPHFTLLLKTSEYM